jgi:AcrR family transcriptional regulator
LSRESIVAAALDRVDEFGSEAVTMRRVAQAVDTAPASLYVYVKDRRELMTLVHDLAVDDVELPTDSDGGWRTRLELLVERTVSALAAHGDIAAVGLTDVATGPNALRIIEEILRLLRAGGVGDEACAWAADLLGQYIASTALEEAVWLREQRVDLTRPDAEQATADALSTQLDVVYAALPVEDYPTLRELAPLLAGGNPSTRAAWKLRVLLDGLLAQP